MPCYNLLLIIRLMYAFPSLLLCNYVSGFWRDLRLLKLAQGHGFILIGNSSKQCPILLIMAPSVSRKAHIPATKVCVLENETVSKFAVTFLLSCRMTPAVLGQYNPQHLVSFSPFEENQSSALVRREYRHRGGMIFACVEGKGFSLTL